MNEKGPAAPAGHRTLLTEVVYFLREDGLPVDPGFQVLERNATRLEFDLAVHWPRIRTLMSRYRQMDLADASVVVMTELHVRSRVLTIERRTSPSAGKMIVR